MVRHDTVLLDRGDPPQAERGPGPIPPDGPLARPKSLRQTGVPTEVTATAAPPDNPQTPEKIALSDSAKRGWDLFNTKARCNKCHALSEEQRDPTFFADGDFHNIGVGIIRHNVVALAVLITAPYFDDGSQATLWDVMDHDNHGDGIQNPWPDEDMQPLALSESEIDDVVAFLAALTSVQYQQPGVKDPGRQRAVSRMNRPQRDTARIFGPWPVQPKPSRNCGVIPAGTDPK